MSEHETAYDEAKNLEKFQTQFETELEIQLKQRTLLQQLKVDNQRLTEINGQLQDEVRILHKVIDILHEKKYSITEPNNPTYYRVDRPMQTTNPTKQFIYPVEPSDPIPMPNNPIYPNIKCMPVDIDVS